MRASTTQVFFLFYFTMGICFVFGLTEDFQIIRYLAYSFKLSLSESQNVEVLQLVGLLMSCFVAAPFLSQINTKTLLSIYSLMMVVLSLLILFLKIFFLVEIFYVWVGFGFGMSRILVYDYASQKRNLWQTASLLCQMEAVYSLGLLLNFYLVRYFADFDTPDMVNIYWVSLPLLIVIFLYAQQIPENIADKTDNKDTKISNIKKEANIIQKFREMYGLLSYNLVGLFLACIFIISTVEYHFVMWLSKATVSFIPIKAFRFEVGMLSIFSTALVPFVVSYLLKGVRLVQWVNLTLFAFIILSITVVENFKYTFFRSDYESIWQVPHLFYVFYVQIGLWATVMPIIFSIALRETPQTLRIKLLGLTFGMHGIFSVIAQLMSNYLYSSFSPLISYLFISIALSALIVLLLLFTSDLRRDSLH